MGHLSVNYFHIKKKVKLFSFIP